MSERSNSLIQIHRDIYKNTDFQVYENIDQAWSPSPNAHCYHNKLPSESKGTWQLKEKHCPHSTSKKNQQESDTNPSCALEGPCDFSQVQSKVFSLKDEVTQISYAPPLVLTSIVAAVLRDCMRTSKGSCTNGLSEILGNKGKL